MTFLTNCYESYLRAPPQVRRQMNQAVFERFLINEDGASEAALAGTFGVLLAPDLIQPPDASSEPNETLSAIHRNSEWLDGYPATLPATRRLRGAGSNKPRPTKVGLGSKASYLVPPAGFEPALPA